MEAVLGVVRYSDCIIPSFVGDDGKHRSEDLLANLLAPTIQAQSACSKVSNLQ
jgi:hypothetical protein